MNSRAYNPSARHATPLAQRLAQHIRTAGAISVADYMQYCLHDSENGYYRVRQVIGRDGDFITAPEISQVFGELFGLWCAVVWQQMGSPGRIQLVEIGPGRGTLMQDVLRAAAAIPAFRASLDVHLVETSAVLAAQQRAALDGAGVPVQWHARMDWRPDAPVILIANELLDTIAVSQWVRCADGWRERVIGLDAQGQLDFFVRDGLPSADANWIGGAIGEIAERQWFGELANAIMPFVTPLGFAALLVDYGHIDSMFGDTLQAVRNHAHEHPLTSPGEADISCQVDFSALQSQMRAVFAADMLAIDGPTTQAEFLGRLGLIERASRLMTANPDKAGNIEAGIVRLMAPDGMGTRFKAIGLRSAHLSALPGL